MSRVRLVLALSACAWLSGCGSTPRAASFDPVTVPDVVTADIQAGIEAHIEREAARGGGYFELPYDGGTLRMKLVRVHTEYLANLGPRRHFACVDLASTEGDVYDVDFFLEGDPGAMRVTETTVHKLNGQPFYLWDQNDEGVWVRTAVEGADPRLLGIVEGEDHFEFLYQATLPELGGEGRMWIPLPSSDAFQTVSVREMQTPGTRDILTDERFGNKVLYLSLSPEDSGKSIVLRFDVRRLEKSAYAGGGASVDAALDPERLVPRDAQIAAIAMSVTQGMDGDLQRARALYDYTIDRMRYMKFGSGWGQGDAINACGNGTGNCTDFHAYFIALARSVGIPARFAIGAAIPSERDYSGIDGYHCWAEFYAEGKWWPVDISEADKYSSLSTYYFGHNPANRLELSRGRDIEVSPGPESGPINFLAFPVLEVGGKPVPIKPMFSFTRNES